MEDNADVLKAVKRAFSETISLKLQQFYNVVPKGSNSDLTGKFVEEMVRGFVQQWIAPCQLVHGTLHPHDAAMDSALRELGPRQIDGIVYDPRLGPAILREGSFLVAHPAFCRGIIEIKASTTNIKRLWEDLQLHYHKYLAPAWKDASVFLCANHVMGIVIQDPDPKGRSSPEWMRTTPLYCYYLADHCPIFILFKEQDGVYEPYEPGIDAMIKGIFHANWQKPLNVNRIYGDLLPP